jgi:hypothetical protein
MEREDNDQLFVSLQLQHQASQQNLFSNLVIINVFQVRVVEKKAKQCRGKVPVGFN